MTDEEKSIKEFIFASKSTDAQKVAQEKIIELKKQKHDLKYELYQLRQRVDELEQIVEKDRNVISMLLQISDNLLSYINVTAAHVKQLENKEKEAKE